VNFDHITMKFTLTKSRVNEDRFIAKFFPERIHIFHIKDSSLKRTFRLTKQNRGTNVFVKVNT